MTIRSRIAPTPSGYLHIGNAVNFVLTWLMVRCAGGSLRLRIDDGDCNRSRPEYLDDIFRQLEWLGITWDEGPQSPDDFVKNFSQQHRTDRYRIVMDELLTKGLAYPCDCSRSAIRKTSPTGIYPGSCRHLSKRPADGYALRLRLDCEAPISLHGRTVHPGHSMGDFILWRKDNLPAYQLASLVDDMDHGINLIVRGADLIESTAAQLLLARHLDCETFRAAVFHHHPLLCDSKGGKLSKSDNALSLQAMRESGATPAVVFQEAARLLNIGPAPITELDQLLELLSLGQAA